MTTYRRVALSDGTDMELNTNTEVRVRFLEKERQVTLVCGEAFFSVAHDSARPFYVKVEDNTVRAVGTQFVVRLRQGHAVDVLVTEGRVEVNGSFGNSTAGAGTLTRVRGAHAEKESLSESEVEKRLAWTKGWLIFAGETLAQAVAEFNRYSQRRLVVRDARVANLQIGGVFSVEHPDPDHFASALQSFGIEAHHVNQAGEDVILLQRGAP